MKDTPKTVRFHSTHKEVNCMVTGCHRTTDESYIIPIGDGLISVTGPLCFHHQEEITDEVRQHLDYYESLCEDNLP